MTFKYSIFLIGASLLILTTAVSSQELLCNNFEGIIEPSETVEISSEVEGVIDRIHAKRGDWVKAGDLVATLKSNVEKAAVELAKARVEFEKRKDARKLELFKKKLISLHEKDELETEILLAELALDEAEERLAQHMLRTPVSGIVTERHLSPGEHINEDAVMTVARINPLYVEIVIPVECYGKIKVGQSALAVVDHPFKNRLKCRVIVVDRVVDAASATFNVRLRLDNPGGKLPAGLKCTVQF